MRKENDYDRQGRYKYNNLNSITLAAMEEGDQMINDPDARRFDSVEALFEELNEE
ncbi:MAG: hypothetical protein LUG99_01185 [Lachnospiraceae bacterium]|nr:hypothetical protein [Lachnospiraceae bacterium]